MTDPSPRCIVIAGPNGSGKTTFAREYLTGEAPVIYFINADLIAAGLSPLAPERAALSAGRLMLGEIDRLMGCGEDFAFESTLSGRTYVTRLNRLKSLGYFLENIYLKVASPRLLVRRIVTRVKQGGHPVPTKDVLRPFDRSWKNFESIYRPLANAWTIYDNSALKPFLIQQGP